ncbi:hypothetical protein MsAg5_08200 [Methanosarcinaceae archaeon Ag5]|uniref:CMP/dCMP-type deaminase domain-containing protein n=1 Tax=Methanolapillus africanus TaxID=3028297 RepID=A0AAE4MI11_9EURY|nr:hypothetical protein [Methanosarcinaceae archaeon Ag5]
MFNEPADENMNSLDEFAKQRVLMQADIAASEKSYGVGGVLINLKTGAFIKEMHNTVIARDNDHEQSRLKDPTAHGERQLVDWYFMNKTELNLPEPKDILLVTSLDPCLMCTGSTLSAGFNVIIVALDENAGINWDSTYRFNPLEGPVLNQIKNNFIYPKVAGDPVRQGYGKVPLFTNPVLSQQVVEGCKNAFTSGANVARSIVKDIVPYDKLLDLSMPTAPAHIIQALKAECPDALAYKTRSKSKTPDEGLAQYLIAAAKEDIKNGGDGDAVAFIDPFGNLLMCKSGKKSISPIRSAFMETVRAYQKVRYDLSKTSNTDLKYLCDPSFGTFVFVKGFDKSAPSFTDFGAYGSTMLNAPMPENLQYIIPRIDHNELLNYIGGMPKRYGNIIKPVVVKDQNLVNRMKAALTNTP